jgi:ABC-type transport auxiliary lipoprotein component
VLRIKIDVRRFDAVMASHTDLEASWSLRPLTTREEPVAALCASRIREPVVGSSESADSAAATLVRSHQRAVARLGSQIAEAASRWIQKRAEICPAASAGNP